MREFLNAIIIIVYYIYSDEYYGSESLFFWCVLQFIIENIFKNFCKVGGSLFQDLIRVIEVIKYMLRSWDILRVMCVKYILFL